MANPITTIASAPPAISSRSAVRELVDDFGAATWIPCSASSRRAASYAPAASVLPSVDPAGGSAAERRLRADRAFRRAPDAVAVRHHDEDARFR